MEHDPGVLLDPARVAIGIGAFVGLIAANEWRKVWRSVEASGEIVGASGKRGLADAALWTAVALFLSSAGYLFGVFFGHV